jgi:hypothetical protein
MKARARNSVRRVESAQGEDGKRFVFRVLSAAAFVLVAGLLLLVGTSLLGREALSYQRLLDYQFGKVAAGLPNLIFVGDSSLGNAIDVEAWRNATGQDAANLALTGSFGYAGSLAMVKNALASSPIETVVVMHTMGTMARPVNDEAIDLVEMDKTRWNRLKRWWRLNVNLQQLADAVEYTGRRLAQTFGLREPDRQRTIQNDYVAQRAERVPANSEFRPLDPKSIRPEPAYYLNLLADLCIERRLNCVYVHGPSAAPICEASAPFFDAVNRLISRMGLQLASARPFCIPTGLYGDTADHVAPEGKAEATRAYAVMLSPFIGPRPSTQMQRGHRQESSAARIAN